jgi:hypothetical protein
MMHVDSLGSFFQALGKFNNLFEILRLEHRAVRVD